MPYKDSLKDQKYHREYSKKWYESQRETHKKLQVDSRKLRIARNVNYIKEVKSQPCTDCGVCYPWYVMHFDHLPEYEKDTQVSNMRCWSLQRIQKEIAKCEVVCANCHAERTYSRSHAPVV